MKYESVVPATFISRPNRFIAHVKLENSSQNDIEVVHLGRKRFGRGEILRDARKSVRHKAPLRGMLDGKLRFVSVNIVNKLHT